MSSILRWSARIVGLAMVAIGAVPFTPLIWLLVLVRTPVWWPVGLHLRFWQTQGIGAGVASVGAAVIWLTFRKRRTALS